VLDKVVYMIYEGIIEAA